MFCFNLFINFFIISIINTIKNIPKHTHPIPTNMNATDPIFVIRFVISNIDPIMPIANIPTPTKLIIKNINANITRTEYINVIAKHDKINFNNIFMVFSIRFDIFFAKLLCESDFCCSFTINCLFSFCFLFFVLFYSY